MYDPEKSVLSDLVIDLGDNRTDDDFLKQMYGDDVLPTVNTLVNQLAIVECLFPGLDLDVLRYFVPLADVTTPLLPSTKLKMVNGCNILGKLCSCLARPRALEPIANLLEIDEKDYLDLEMATIQTINDPPIQVDGSYATNQVKTNKIDTDNSSGDWMNFKEETLDENDPIGEKAILVTTTASAATLSLFANMGPSPTQKQSDMDVRIQHNLVSQPPFNHRETVTSERLRKLLKTCSGKNHANLTAHGVCVHPYTICVYDREIPQDSRNPLFAETGVQKTMTQRRPFPFDLQLTNGLDNDYNRVGTCYRTESRVKALYGAPFALTNERKQIETLFSVLLGVEWSQVAVEPDCSTKMDGKPWNDYKSSHVMATIMTSILIKLVEIEYHGFRSIDDWKKLHWRLRQSHLPCSQDIALPTTKNDLVYQCMVLTQAASKFRLAFLDGLNRVVAAKHSLVGVYPEDNYGPNFPKSTISPCDFNVVGASNTKVEIVDFGFKTLSKKQQLNVIRGYGEHLQELAQTLTKTDVVSFLDDWYSFIEKHVREDDDTDENWCDYTFPELRVPFEKCVGGKKWYSANRFKTFSSRFPLAAIRHIENKAKKAKDESHFLRQYISYMIVSSNKSWTNGSQDKIKADKSKIAAAAKRNAIFTPTKAPTALDTYETQVAWFIENLRAQFDNGYFVRSANVWAPDMCDLVMIMSYGLISVPTKNREMTGRLKFLCLEGGAKPNRKYLPASHKFMNPASESLPTMTADDYLGVSWVSDLFMKQDDVQVRRNRATLPCETGYCHCRPPVAEIVSVPMKWIPQIDVLDRCIGRLAIVSLSPVAENVSAPMKWIPIICCCAVRLYIISQSVPWFPRS